MLVIDTTRTKRRDQGNQKQVWPKSSIQLSRFGRRGGKSTNTSLARALVLRIVQAGTASGKAARSSDIDSYLEKPQRVRITANQHCYETLTCRTKAKTCCHTDACHESQDVSGNLRHADTEAFLRVSRAAVTGGVSQP